jgi:hypothetical protein
MTQLTILMKKKLEKEGKKTKMKDLAKEALSKT